MSHDYYKQIQKSHGMRKLPCENQHENMIKVIYHLILDYRLCQWATVQLHICHSMFNKPDLALHISPSQSQCALTIVMFMSKSLEHQKSMLVG